MQVPTACRGTIFSA